MVLVEVVVRWIPFLFVVLGCAGDGETGETDPATDSAPEADPCVEGCAATLAAACMFGPPDATTCEADCRRLRDDATCGTDYEALLTCGDGEPVVCDGDGFPSIAACPTEETAFRTCLAAG